VTDQRGRARPQAPACDIGAFELEQAPPPSGTPTGGGNPPPVTTTPARLSVKLILRKQRLLTALSRGYRARFESSGAARGVLEVFVERSQARGLGASARTRVRVARGTRSLTKPGRGTVIAKFTRKSRKVLRKRRTVKVLVRLTVTDRSGRRSVKSQRVTLAR
jgi:hypothetical protein